MPALDPDKLAELTSYYGAGFLAELAGLYVEDSQRLAALLEQGLRTGDREDVTRASHDLKSTSAQVGANRVSQAASDLEQAVRRGDTLEQLRALEAVFTPLFREALAEAELLAKG